MPMMNLENQSLASHASDGLPADPSARIPAITPRPAIWPRAERALGEELTGVPARLLLANSLVSLLPRLAFSRLRTAIYRAAGIAVGPRSLFFGKADFNGKGAIWRRLSIGADCQINSPLFFDLNGNITIGNRVSIGHHVVFVTADHEMGPPEHRCGTLKSAPIVIEDGAWIGAGVTVLPGVTIGPGSVVSVGSVVAADVPANRLVGGVPARIVKQLPGSEEVIKP